MKKIEYLFEKYFVRILLVVFSIISIASCKRGERNTEKVDIIQYFPPIDTAAAKAAFDTVKSVLAIPLDTLIVKPVEKEPLREETFFYVVENGKLKEEKNAFILKESADGVERKWATLSHVSNGDTTDYDCTYLVTKGATKCFCQHDGKDLVLEFPFVTESLKFKGKVLYKAKPLGTCSKRGPVLLKGVSLEAYAIVYGITVKQLKQLNPTIKIGDRLCVEVKY